MSPSTPMGTSKRAQHPPRAPWGTLSRIQIVDAALAMLQEGGLESLSIRSLAAHLGIAPMSIYRHVRDKDDLLDEVVDRLLEEAWRPSVSSQDWMIWVSQAAEKLRRFLVTQPAALHVYLRHPVASPAAIARMDAMLDVLRAATIDEDEAQAAYAAIHTYSLGFAALEASRAEWRPSPGSGDLVARQLAAYSTSTQFAAGLAYLLEGIERRQEDGGQ